MTLPRILHYPGSKWSMADWIISHMPEHTTYLEPFFGSGAVFFNKTQSRIETINDIDSNVVNLFRVIRDRPAELAAMIEMTPFSREEYYHSYEMDSADSELERARKFLVRCWQAIGGKQSERTGWRSLISANGTFTANEWNVLPEKILQVTNRLKDAQIENQSVFKLLERYKRANVCIYADPPYILETRTTRQYKYEMTMDEHEMLLERLLEHPGPVLLSGYHHRLYNEKLAGWKTVEFTMTAEAGAKRTEVLWLNEKTLVNHQTSLF